MKKQDEFLVDHKKEFMVQEGNDAIIAKEENPTKNYAAFLASNPNGVLSTIAEDGIRSRIFQHLWCEGKRAYFCTSRKKEVSVQLKKNPQVNFCTYDPDSYASLCIRGKAVFVEDMAAKKRALDENPGIKDIYKSPDNPDFEIFYVNVEAVDAFSFSTGKVSETVQ